MTPTTLLSMLSRGMINISQIHTVIFNHALEALDMMHPYRRFMSEHYFPAKHASLHVPSIVGFGIGHLAYRQLLERCPKVQLKDVCEDFEGLEVNFDSSLVVVDVSQGTMNLGNIFSVNQETILEYEQSFEGQQTNSKSIHVFDFAFQACIKIINFKITGEYHTKDQVDLAGLLKIFVDFTRSNDQDMVLELQSWIDRIQSSLHILNAVGLFAASVYIQNTLYELEQLYTRDPMPISGKFWSTLQISQSDVSPQDISAKSLALFEFLESFHDPKTGASSAIVIVEDNQIAKSLYLLLLELSKLFSNIAPAHSSDGIDDMKLFNEGQRNTLIITDLEGEKDFSKLFGMNVVVVVFFDASEYSLGFFSQLECSPDLSSVFSSCTKQIMIESNDQEALKFVINNRLASQSARFTAITETLIENTKKDLASFLMGQMGITVLKSKKKATVQAELALQLVSWFCSKNRLAAPYLIQMWPPENSSELEEGQIKQEWLTLVDSLTTQFSKSKLGSQEELNFLKPLSSGDKVLAHEVYAFACCWTVGTQEYTVYGFPRISEKLAQNNAALLACQDMYQNLTYLDENLLPIKLSAKTGSGAKDCPYSAARPSAFEPVVAAENGGCSLYLTVLVLQPATSDGDQDSQPYPPPFFTRQYVAIATKNPVPVDFIPFFDVYPRKIERYTVEPHHFNVLSESVYFTPKQMKIIEKFQDKVWGDYVGLKPKEDDEFTRWFSMVPVLYTPPTSDDEAQQTWSIDWDFLDKCLEHSVPCTAYQFLSHIASTETPIQSAALEVLKAKSRSVNNLEELLSQYNGQDLNGFIDYLNQALSDVVVGVLHEPISKYMNLRVDTNISGNDQFVVDDNCISFADFYRRKGIHVPHTSVFGLQGERVHRYVNTLTKTAVDASQEEYMSILLDVAHVLPISESFLQQLWVVPSIISHLESYCIIEDFFTEYDGAVDSIPRHLIHPAIMHSGMEREENYERLEFLGDASLKLIISMYLYQYEGESEGALTRNKSVLVSNANLNNIGRENKIDSLIQTTKFNPWFFKPPRFEPRSGKQAPERSISQKTCADVVEALAGAFYLDGGIASSWRFFEAIGLVPGMDHVWLEVDKQIYFTEASTFPQFECVEEIEQILGYRFNTPVLLVQALTHSTVSLSFNYERLEFLGDAVLDLMLAKYTYDCFPLATPQDLSNMRVNAVNNEALSRMSYSIGLHKFLKSHGLELILREYTTYLDTLEPYADPYKTEIEGPKIMGDIFESLVGAVYFDCRGDLDRVWQVVFLLWKPYLDKFIGPELIFVSDLRNLYEFPGVDGKQVSFQFLNGRVEGGKMVETCNLFIAGKLYATAGAQSKKLAKESAARQALSVLEASRKEE